MRGQYNVSNQDKNCRSIRKANSAVVSNILKLIQHLRTKMAKSPHNKGGYLLSSALCEKRKRSEESLAETKFFAKRKRDNCLSNATDGVLQHSRQQKCPQQPSSLSEEETRNHALHTTPRFARLQKTPMQQSSAPVAETQILAKRKRIDSLPETTDSIFQHTRHQKFPKLPPIFFEEEIRSVHGHQYPLTEEEKNVLPELDDLSKPYKAYAASQTTLAGTTDLFVSTNRGESTFSQGISDPLVYEPAREKITPKSCCSFIIHAENRSLSDHVRYSEILNITLLSLLTSVQASR